MKAGSSKRQYAGAQFGTEAARFLSIEMGAIAEPELPARETMDEQKMLELSESMSAIGLQQPIIVEEMSSGFRIVAGHRRFLAARRIYWTHIPALVYPAGAVDVIAVMVHENACREDLNPAQEAVWFMQLIEARHLDEAGICALTKRSPTYIGDRLALLRNDERVFEACRSGEISFAVARVLNRFKSESMRRYYLDAAIRAGTSAKVVEQWLRDYEAQTLTNVAEAVERSTTVASVAVEDSPDKVKCMFCGGDRDPYNLVAVMIHKWELAHILKALDVRREAEAEAAASVIPIDSSNG